jgi:hypothetical protein
MFSPDVSSRDGKMVVGSKNLRYRDGLVFIMPEEVGRALDVLLKSDSKYVANLYCELRKSSKAYVAHVYKVETIAVSGAIKDTFEEKIKE